MTIHSNEREWENTLAQFIIEHLPHIPADLEIGQAISALDGCGWIISIGVCPVGMTCCPNFDLCRQFCKYAATLHRKQCQFEIAITFRDYLQVRFFQSYCHFSNCLQRCGIDIEAHEYNTEHDGCISCESTPIFLQDIDFGSWRHISE